MRAPPRAAGEKAPQLEDFTLCQLVTSNEPPLQEKEKEKKQQQQQLLNGAAEMEEWSCKLFSSPSSPLRSPFTTTSVRSRRGFFFTVSLYFVAAVFAPRAVEEMCKITSPELRLRAVLPT